jgi:hypothetical protein
MKATMIYALAAVALLIGAALLWQAGVTTNPAPAYAQAAGEPLAPYMGHFQRYTHKLALAIDAGNQPLAEFYAAKVRENMGVVEKKFPKWETFQVGALVTAMLGAPLKPVEDALKAGDMAKASTAYDALIGGCNNCHVATQRQFIKVTRSNKNPYEQDFSK